MPTISDRHRAELEHGSGIAMDIIIERGYVTAESAHGLPSAFADYQRRAGLVIPIRDTTGHICTWQLKADRPRLDKRGKTIKYDTAVGGRQCLDIPSRSLHMLSDPSVPLWITEGAKKVDSALSHGIGCIIGLQGVYGWRGQNDLGGLTALADWEDIALNGRDVVLAFDSDVMTKMSVRNALERLSAFLKKRTARMHYLLLPDPGFDREDG